MATRKKKSDPANDIPLATDAKAFRKPRAPRKVVTQSWPKVTVGTHLTVTEHEDGRTELVWDDAALLSEVRAAILKAESTVPVKAKRASKKQ